MSECMFCGARTDLTDEDVLPMWLARRYHAREGAKQYGMSTLSFNHDGDPLADDAGQWIVDEQRKIGNLPRPFKLPKVCAQCNNGWMSRLENATKPIMGPLIDERAAQVDEVAQRLLTMWAIKTALTYNEAVFPGSIPFDFGSRRLYRDQAPMPLTHVVIGAAPNLGYRHMRMIAPIVLPIAPFLPQSRPIGATVRAAFQFDHLVIQVAINWPEFVPPELAQAAMSPGVHEFAQIWPYVQPITWPLPHLPPTKKVTTT